MERPLEASELPEGHETFVYPNGDRYQGPLLGGTPNGSGHIFFKDGTPLRTAHPATRSSV